MAVDAGNEALIGKARQFRDVGKLEEAEKACREALELRADDAEAHRMLGTVLQDRGSYEAALASFEQALRLDPGNAKTYKQLGEIMAEHGRTEEAIAAARQALELRPDYAGVLAAIAALKKFESANDADLAAMEKLVGRGDQLEDGERMLLLFALGKAYGELRDYDRSFACLHEANALKRATIEYDVDEAVGFVDRISEVFDVNLFEQFPDCGSSSQIPVLVLGMPRSGTSLVEQILASHPEVHGGGERVDLYEISTAVGVLSEGQVPFPEGVAGLRPGDLRSLGAGYSERVKSIAPNAARVIDKDLLNFLYVGLARLIIPHARIVHCVRDPLDTCLSCYSLNFRGLPFSYDLQELGRYYRAYSSLMDHWRTVLPPGWVLDMRYEDLVAEPEREVRRLVEHCGLPWDDACLGFYSTKRVVRTGSFAQVRRPIYATSIGRWRPYEAHLGPLFDALGATPECASAQRRSTSP